MLVVIALLAFLGALLMGAGLTGQAPGDLLKQWIAL